MLSNKVALAKVLALAGTLVMIGLPHAVIAQQMTNEGLPPSDPLMQLAQQDQPRDQFTLDSSQDVELVRFKSPHLLSICAARAPQNAMGAAKHGYPLMLSFDDDTAIITPGNCLAFEAQRVKVRPASQLPQNIVLQGTVRVLK